MKSVDYQLRQFIQIAKHKSLSDAAITLGVTQSALSKQLREIETVVGHPVFRRHGRGIELTEQGDTLWRAAQTAYKLVDTTISQLQVSRKPAPSELRVATVHGTTQVVVREVLTNLFGRQTTVDVMVMEATSAEIVNHVGTGAVDVGFVDASQEIPESLKVTQLAQNSSAQRRPVSAHSYRANEELATTDVLVEFSSPFEERPIRHPISPTQSENRDNAAIPVDQPTLSAEALHFARNLVAVTRKGESRITSFLVGKSRTF
ncbi:LysR family transcriptional regulator [Burkholderia sp. THE68]|uniref:LysR family transcriptional regulator n=1 Tax=Burkholderia sp. THE68 TaxID=758782 RepID=UPI001389A280|nr:LysR family transcriptional regulator [Burkholderia sp. THE68]